MSSSSHGLIPFSNFPSIHLAIDCPSPATFVFVWPMGGYLVVNLLAFFHLSHLLALHEMMKDSQLMLFWFRFSRYIQQSFALTRPCRILSIGTKREQ